MRFRPRSSIIIAWIAALAAQPVCRAATNRIIAQPTAEEVKAAMVKAVDFLLSQKRKDNFETHGIPWIDAGPNNGGETALVTYALLHAGRSLNDARLSPNSTELKPVLEYLAKVQQNGTYTAGLTALALDFLPKNDATRSMFRLPGMYLLSAMNQNPRTRNLNGGYTYNRSLTRQQLVTESEQQLAMMQARLTEATSAGDDQAMGTLKKGIDAEKGRLATLQKDLHYGPNSVSGVGPPDNSNSQYGVLGAWAMEQSGIEVPTAYWELENNYWRINQAADGGWQYQNNHDPGNKTTQTMTVAGVASLYIIAQFLDTQVRLEPRRDPQLEKGLAKVIADYKVNNDLYYLYGVERVGLASGLKFFGTKNWFRQGAELLVKSQYPNGAFSGNFPAAIPTTSTAYALIFLARGRNAVPFNKLQYDGPWNARPLDDANLVDWMGDQYEKEFNWQVVSTAVEPEQWMDSPILMITGSKALNFSAADKAKIKKFVEMGGMIFSSTDGASSAFDRSIKALMKELFPQYPATLLKRDSVFYNGSLKTKPIREAPTALGVYNGVRYLWVHTPADMGAAWQRRAYARVADFEFPLNLYFYQVSMDTSHIRLETPVITPGDAKTVRSVSLARLDLGSNNDPEPYAIQRLSLLLRADALTDAKISTVKPSELPTAKPTLVLLTGTEAIKPSADDTAALAAYLKGGGTLLADAAGGNPDFTASMVALVQQLVPGGTLEDIPANDHLLDGSEPGAVAITSADYRRFARDQAHARGNEMHDVRLRGIKIGNRWAVIFSEYDITSGLLGTDTWGINGYASDTAEAIGRDVTMYAAAGGK